MTYRTAGPIILAQGQLSPLIGDIDVTYLNAWNLTSDTTRNQAVIEGWVSEWDVADKFIDAVDAAVNASEIADNTGFDD